MVTKKHIRVKFITIKGEHAKFITLNDTVIPPVNQLERLIQKIKNDYKATEIPRTDVFDAAEEFIWEDVK